MLSIDKISNDREATLIGLKKRGFRNLEVIDKLIELNSDRKQIQQKLDQILFESTINLKLSLCRLKQLNQRKKILNVFIYLTELDCRLAKHYYGFGLKMIYVKLRVKLVLTLQVAACSINFF